MDATRWVLGGLEAGAEAAKLRNDLKETKEVRRKWAERVEKWEGQCAMGGRPYWNLDVARERVERADERIVELSAKLGRIENRKGRK